MAKKRDKIFRKNDKLRVRKSYYTFTREYPKYIEVEKTGRHITPRSLRKAAVYGGIFLLLVSLSCFVFTLGINISYKPIDETQENIAVKDNEIILSEGIRALYMPTEKMGDEEYIRQLIKEIRKKDANSVVIDFKTPEGKLCYTSIQESAIAAGCALYDNDTARKTVDLFIQKDIAVIARIYCYRDNAVAGSVSDMAVKYMDTTVNWLDGIGEDSGNAWLNPYDKSVREYLTAVAKEISGFGVRAFILEDFQFPEGKNTDSATYPGEKTETKRNTVLKNTYKQIKKALPENSVIILSQSADDALSGNESIYYGSMADIDCYGIAVDTGERPLSVAVDKKTDFTSVLSMYYSISQCFPEKQLIPIIYSQEYSYSYFRAMKKNGFGNFILIDEKGEY